MTPFYTLDFLQSVIIIWKTQELEVKVILAPLGVGF
jgi:hypothetical protein